MGNLTAVGKMRIDKAAPSERMADRSGQALRMPEISTHAEELTMRGLFWCGAPSLSPSLRPAFLCACFFYLCYKRSFSRFIHFTFC